MFLKRVEFCEPAPSAKSNAHRLRGVPVWCRVELLHKKSDALVSRGSQKKKKVFRPRAKARTRNFHKFVINVSDTLITATEPKLTYGLNNEQ